MFTGISDMKKRQIDLELATMTDIFRELKSRGYQFIFVGERDKTNVTSVFFGTDDVIQPVRMAGEAINTSLDICKKLKVDNGFVKISQSVMLQLEVLFGTNHGEQGAKI